MATQPNIVRRLAQGEAPLFHQLNDLFGAAFGDAGTYQAARPTTAYLERLLEKEHIIPLVALAHGRIIGGLVAYELDKFEQDRREIYIYDLAVHEEYRRQGVATALIRHLRQIASQRGAWVIYVQADYGDEAAIALYTKLGHREDVLHFDICA
jgi:aminoglycoside 3-N-acetyltransferase I